MARLNIVKSIGPHSLLREELAKERPVPRRGVQTPQEQLPDRLISKAAGVRSGTRRP